MSAIARDVRAITQMKGTPKSGEDPAILYGTLFEMTLRVAHINAMRSVPIIELTTATGSASDHGGACVWISNRYCFVLANVTMPHSSALAWSDIN